MTASPTDITDDFEVFDVFGPLPSGVTVLEASAGTGKTFTIAALATRYVAEAGIPLENLLLVTFTRMATGELRARVRERLVAAEEGLTAVLAGAVPDATDELLVHLANTTASEVHVRRDRLRAALSGFDAATIDTTHAFCQRVLNGLGVTGDVDRDAGFVEESLELIDEVVTDFYLRKFAFRDDPAFTLDEARRIAKYAVANMDAVIHPPATGDREEDVRRNFAERVREEVDRRRRLTNVLTFDDLLTRLRNTLADEERGELAGRRLRDRYRVALVDEFQDTDPIQWDILRRAFVEGDADATLVLIGDPKQAIYAFRGADVFAYLDAARVAGRRATLRTNYRSDQALLDAYDAVFQDARLGHEGIVYRKVEASPAHAARPGLTGAPVDAPLRIRMVHRADRIVKLTERGYLTAAGARAAVAADVARDIVALLSSGAEVDDGGRESAAGVTRVRPGHIAVLVQRNVDAMAVRDALHASGVPAVVAGAGSVFATPSAREWLRLLEALERPSSANNVRAVALTAFIGWTPEEVATSSDERWEALHAKLHRWAGVLRRRGVAALLETIALREQLAARLLANANGERELTDIRHVAQLLHAEVMAEQLGITALTAWLHTRIDEADEDLSAEDRSRRLESDAEAVQVLTIYRSKGLEFPVVYCPYLWHPGWIEPNDPPIFHDPNKGEQRTIDVSGTGRSKGRRILELRGEELRLLYVALTRAKHQAVIWWAATYDSRQSSLCRLLFHRDARGNVASDVNRAPPPLDDDAVARFEALAEAANGRISFEHVAPPAPARWTSSIGGNATLEASTFDRTLDPTWRRTSYTALTSAVHEATVASEAEEPVVSDEVLPVMTIPRSSIEAEARPGDDDAVAELRPLALPLSAMRAGADVGTFVHSIFEECDFAADDIDAEMGRAFDVATSGGAVDVGDRELVIAGLRAALDTPLGPVTGEFRLRDLTRRDRVDELGFELPLVGGDTPTGVLDVASIGLLLERHLAPGDPLHSYAAHLRDPMLQSELRGYLSGSLDLVLRTPDGRFAVVDYKTNRLGESGDDLTAWHYRPAAVLDAMYRAHYPLQALLYVVALHRYLRWRLPAYDPERHLAGVLYLFVRGMIGPDTPRVDGQPTGVFAWKPPAALVEALSDLFDAGRAAP